MNPAMPDDVEIGYSNSRMLPLVALAATMTLINASNAFDWFGDSRTHALVGCAGLGFIGIATCGLISRLSAANGPTLLIGGYGISDLRVANEFKLRGLITGVFVCNYRRRHLVALKITPELCADRERNGGAMDCVVRMMAKIQFEGRPVQRFRGRVPFGVKCCGSATSRKNQSAHHLFAQELGKLPVRNSLSAYVVHCARNSAQCPIGSSVLAVDSNRAALR